jgi:hypothetical protein
MATEPKVTNYAVPAGPGWTNIPCTKFGVKVLEIEECPAASGATQAAFSPQGLQYQLWDYSLIPTPGAVAGGWGPTLQAFPGLIAVGDGFTVVGNNAQPANWAGTRAADVPIRIMSGTAVATQVNVREYCSKIATATL